MNRRFQGIIFDFDFTLCDTSPAAVACIQYAFASMGLPEPSPKHARKTIGLSLQDTFSALAAVVPQAKEESSERFARLFIEKADEIVAEQAVLYPGVHETLESLINMGMQLGVVSNKFRHRIEDIGRRHSLPPFEVVVGCEDVDHPKPAPDGIRLALKHLQLSAEDVLYVGDSSTDGRAAAAVPMSFVAVRTGMAEREELLAWQPLALLSDVTALPSWLERQMGQRAGDGQPGGGGVEGGEGASV